MATAWYLGARGWYFQSAYSSLRKCSVCALVASLFWGGHSLFVFERLVLSNFGAICLWSSQVTVNDTVENHSVNILCPVTGFIVESAPLSTPKIWRQIGCQLSSIWINRYDCSYSALASDSLVFPGIVWESFKESLSDCPRSSALQRAFISIDL
jgi:hypothetical protein